MKKRWVFALMVVVLLPAAMACRLWQRNTAFEDSGLLTPGMPATYCLLALAVLAAVGFFLLGRWAAKGAELGSYLAAFSLPHRGIFAVYLVAGAFLVAAGVLGIREHRLGLDDQLSRYILSIALLPGGLGMALVGWLNTQRREAAGRLAWPLLIPGVCSCLWLIAAYQSNTSNPNAMAYAPYLLGALCAAVCCYAFAAFSFEKPMPLLAVWMGGMALVALSVGLVDGTDSVKQLVALGYLFYLAAQLKCLLTRCDDPAPLERWTPPAEETEIEVENHE